ncbi:MAG: hypothetical protein NT113_10235 [Hyphomicrobiales bacterium]|jgi:hypothetical protein|nr:hypothetical protein [Hyphomicrobiales bacterium]
MSLRAASVTKSCVFGAMPSVHFTPVVSPSDCENAGAARAVVAARMMMNFFMVESLACVYVAAAATPVIDDNLIEHLMFRVVRGCY